MKYAIFFADLLLVVPAGAALASYSRQISERVLATAAGAGRIWRLTSPSCGITSRNCGITNRRCRPENGRCECATQAGSIAKAICKRVNAVCKAASRICKRANAVWNAARPTDRGLRGDARMGSDWERGRRFLDRMYGIVRMERCHKLLKIQNFGRVRGH